MCVYSLHFTAAWVRRIEMGGGLAAPVGCMREGGGDDSEWMFLGKERRRSPGGSGECRSNQSKQRTFQLVFP